MSRKSPTNQPDTEQIDITALVHRPRHLEAIGMLTVEITHMERAVSEMFGVIMGIHFFLGEAIYFTVNSGIARMEIVANAADLVLFSLPDELKKVKRLLERGKACMGKRHAIIHSFWMLNDVTEDIRREKLGKFRKTSVAVVTLAELKQQIRDVQKLSHDLYKFCGEFRDAHPKDTGTLKDYWTPKPMPKKRKSPVTYP
jgi:hypothetical protein